MFLDNIKYTILAWRDRYCDNRANKKYLKKYPDYKVDEYNDGALKLIWGIKSYDDLSGADVNLYTMNDIDITYDRDNKTYSLGVETAYCFNNKQDECEYLVQLLSAFTKFMNENNYNTEHPYFFFMHNPETIMKAESIEELYTNYRIFVEGYCSVYNYKSI